MPSPFLRWCYSGRLRYEDALEQQQRLRAEVAAGERPDTLLLLEHEPVVTLGRSADERHLLVSRGELARRGIALARASRGGDVTYHGPGQLVGYPIRRLHGRGVRAHVLAMVRALRDFLARRSIEARWQERNPGLWTASGKVAAVGVDARGGVTMHGFAFNVGCSSLEGFSLIVPCGLPRPVTCLERLLGRPAPPLAQVAEELAVLLAERLGARPVAWDEGAVAGAAAGAGEGER